jgi:hypothetical protein
VFSAVREQNSWRSVCQTNPLSRPHFRPGELEQFAQHPAEALHRLAILSPEYVRLWILLQNETARRQFLLEPLSTDLDVFDLLCRLPALLSCAEAAR